LERQELRWWVFAAVDGVKGSDWHHIVALVQLAKIEAE
jgi:hypothetical protein